MHTMVRSTSDGLVDGCLQGNDRMERVSIDSPILVLTLTCKPVLSFPKLFK